jgi:chemotaxis signal transduction protein
LLDSENNLFGVNVDGVEDIIHIENEKLHKPKEVQTIGEYMNLEAILEHEGKLITIVKDIHI